MPARSDTGAPRALPWLLALAAFVFDLAAFWPGRMSFDSAYAWWQARGGETTDITAPVLVRLWQLCEALLPGPGLPFGLHLALFWGGLVLLASALRLGAARSVAAWLIVGFAPVPWLLRGHLWSDVGLFSALTFATGALAWAQNGTRRHAWLLALPALLYAAALRHNAWPALLPFLVWTSALALRNAAPMQPRRQLSIAAAALALFAALSLVTQAINAGVQRRVPLWPSLAQWDLAALSIASDDMLLPDFMIGPGLEIAELAEAFRPWSNTPMLTGTRHGMRDPLASDYTTAELSALREAWLGAILTHPRDWLAHRWRLTRALFGQHAADQPRELVYVAAQVGYRDNPPVAHNASTLHATLMSAAAALVTTPLLAAWPYLLAGLFALPWAWRRRDETAGAAALALLASTWLYALPLCVFAPAAELRYLGWPCVASLLALVCATLAPARGAARLIASTTPGTP
jgi:hypothetical protein